VYSSLLATPGVTLNYSMIISQLETTASHVTLSATTKVPGVTLTMRPNEFTFFGTQEPASLGISVDPIVNSSILPVEIVAKTANGETNSTFDFTLDKALVVLLGNGSLTPPTVHVSAGQTVTWLNTIDAHDELVGYADIKLNDGSAASPTMGPYVVWSHTFAQPGTYSFRVSIDGFGTPSGVVIVA
jgi:plastocyanin